MIDPKEKQENQEPTQDSQEKLDNQNTEETNWSSNQQIDEEGSEVDPEDIK